MSYSDIIVTVKCKIQLVELIVFTEATVVKTTEAAEETTEATASVASNVAMAMHLGILIPIFEEVRCGVEPWWMARWKARAEFLLSIA